MSKFDFRTHVIFPPLSIPSFLFPSLTFCISQSSALPLAYIYQKEEWALPANLGIRVFSSFSRNKLVFPTANPFQVPVLLLRLLQWRYVTVMIIIIIVIIIIIIVSFMQGIHTHIPEKNHVPRGYVVAAILSLLFMVPLFLVPAMALLLFYVSTFRSMCAVPNMAVFCNSLTSWLLLLLLLLL